MPEVSSHPAVSYQTESSNEKQAGTVNQSSLGHDEGADWIVDNRTSFAMAYLDLESREEHQSMEEHQSREKHESREEHGMELPIAHDTHRDEIHIGCLVEMRHCATRTKGCPATQKNGRPSLHNEANHYDRQSWSNSHQLALSFVCHFQDCHHGVPLMKEQKGSHPVEGSIRIPKGDVSLGVAFLLTKGAMDTLQFHFGFFSSDLQQF